MPPRLLALLASLALSVPLASAQRKPGKVYTEVYLSYCAACHGNELNEGLGGSLVDGVWKHGGSDAEIARSIREGFPELGMAPWSESIIDDEMLRSLVILIRERESAFAEKEALHPQPVQEQVVATQKHAYRLEAVVEADLLDHPWGIDFLPGGRLIVTERPGTVRLIEADGRIGAPVRGTPPVIQKGQGGMLAVGVHPNYSENGWIYLAFSDGWRQGDRPKGKPFSMTAVVRGRLEGNTWVDQEWIYRAAKEHHLPSGAHFGTRLVFQRGYLFVVVGERGTLEQVQDLAVPYGKVLRLHDDGRVPSDNPFIDQGHALPEIWSYGHRNPQAMDAHPENGLLYLTEHGPRGGDEFNLVKKGANYGWPIISHGMNYDGTPFTSLTAKEGMEQPVTYWTPSIAVCGGAFYQGKAFPRWQNDFLAGALRDESVRRLRLDPAGQLIEEEVLLKGIGRVRAVEVGPDGAVYLAINNPDQIFRLVAAD
ncbi:MAG: PQQ-dependent sugar dehydrogenase [Verrucomicrobiota bacterium]